MCGGNTMRASTTALTQTFSITPGTDLEVRADGRAVLVNFTLSQ